MKKSKIYKFRCTEDALNFGKRASKEEIENLKKSREHFLMKQKRFLGTGKIRYMNIAMIYATYSQFCREAIEVSQ